MVARQNDLRNKTYAEKKIIIAKDLYDQNGITEADRKNWLEKEYGVDKIFVNKIKDMVEQADNILVVTDYDADGVTSAAILSIYCGIINPNANIKIYIPHRHSEGYGFSNQLCDRILNDKKDGKNLIITADNGINNADTIARLKEEGYVIILTDHHMLNQGNRVPEVDIVVNPAVRSIYNPFNFDKYCGAGIVYTLFEPMVTDVKYTKLKEYCRQLAGIATVADVMELVGANYRLYMDTVNDFRNGNAHPNLKYFIRYGKEYCNETTIGFQIAPIFNAYGRMEDCGGEEVAEYLATVNFDKPDSTRMVKGNGIRRDRLLEENQRRKEITKKIKREMFKELGAPEEYADYDRPIWLFIPDAPEGIVGILAGEVTKRYKKPAFVLTETIINSQKCLKGSGRTYGSYNLFDYLSRNRAYFLKYGGHTGAAGCTLTENAYKALKNLPDEAVLNIVDNQSLDYLIDVDDLGDVAEIIEEFRPFGVNNPEPEFEVEVNMNHLSNVANIFGKEDEHVVFNLKSNRITIFNHREIVPENFENKMYHVVGHVSWDNDNNNVCCPNLIVNSMVGTGLSFDKKIKIPKIPKNKLNRFQYGTIPPIPKVKKKISVKERDF